MSRKQTCALLALLKENRMSTEAQHVLVLQVSGAAPAGGQQGEVWGKAEQRDLAKGKCPCLSRVLLA